MNRLVVSVPVLALALVLAPVLHTGAVAADKRPCVTKGEYRQVKKGHTLARAHKVFDTKGKILFQNAGSPTNGAREYRTCKGAGLGATVQLQYNNYASKGGPFRVVHKQSY